MSRVLEIEVPESVDDDWLRKQVETIRARIEDVVFVEKDKDSFDKLGECLDIIDAIQKYTGY